MSQRTLIRGARVIEGDPATSSGEVADVLVEDGRIAAIGPDLESDAEVLDASGGIVAPGFVDTHRHTWQTAMRGICADWTLLDYFRGIRIAASAVYTPEDIYAGNAAGALEALDAGVTCVLDFSHCLISPDHADEAVRGLRDAGLRGVFAYGMFPVGVPDPPFATPESRFDDARRVRTQHFSGEADLLRMGVALTELGLVPWEVTVGEVGVARELDLMITTHTGSVHAEKRPPEVELLDAAGLLDARQVHVHCNACTERELDLLAGAGASVSVTPETELQMGMGYPVTSKLIERGMTPSLGADVISNNRGDLFGQMRLGLGCERARVNQQALDRLEMPDSLSLTAGQMLQFATLGGAKALGLDSEIGSLEAGKAADLVLLRGAGAAMNFAPSAEPVAQAVLHCGPGDVEAVMVAGEWVKRDGELLGDAPGRAYRAVSDSRERIASAVGGWDALLPEPPEGWFEGVIGAMEQNLAGAGEAG